MSVRAFYDNALSKRGFKPDAAQRHAVDRLQTLYDALMSFKEARSGTFNRLKVRVGISPDVPMGIYMWGGVGRGKSFLMDSFYSVIPYTRKTRLHFHEFMREVHRELDELKGLADPLDELALRIAKRYRLICFDEFHVSDIADAMILYRLLDQLLANGVCFVMTSNYEPSKLYPDGLHRDRILPAIELIEQQMEVINVDSGTDYRKRVLEQVQAYHTPLNGASEQALQQAFDELVEGQEESPVLRIEQREIHALRRSGGVVWFDFATLCGGPRSQNDYLEIASQFHTVILSGIPKMPPRLQSEARRFTWLIDVFYDHKVKLLMSAEVVPDELYTEGILSNEFHRTVSRIIEMQSREYLEAPRRVSATKIT